MANQFMTKEARMYNKERIVFSINDVGKTGQTCDVKKMKLDHYLASYIKKINSKWINLEQKI